MSNAAERSDDLPPEWSRLERAAEAAAAALAERERQHRAAQATIEELTATIDRLRVERESSGDILSELEKLREDNGMLRRRMVQARKRITGLMQRLSALNIEP